MKINTYSSENAGADLKPAHYNVDKINPHEVLVKITHCGICHSDLHLIDNDWGYTSYPIVPGHEVAGTIVEMGAEVRNLEIGQRVGIGWLSSSCHICDECSYSNEQFCKEKQSTCVGRAGGFADYIVVDNMFAFPLPDELESENAAPLMCGGITVYSPLKNLGIRHSDKVGIIGIGGLGHLAIQFAAKMGCEVTAFSTSSDKKEEAINFGAKHFVVSSDTEQMESMFRKLDYIITTVNVDLDWEYYLKILKIGGTLCFVGVSPGNINIPVRSILTTQKSITGSIIGGRMIMKEMLEFAALHNIKAKTELFPISQVNEAISKVKNNKARYRVVLKID